MRNIEENYLILESDLRKLTTMAIRGVSSQKDDFDVAFASYEIEVALDKAKAYDILKYKQSQGGKKSSNNMTKNERIKRARKAGKAVKRKEEK